MLTTLTNKTPLTIEDWVAGGALQDRFTDLLPKTNETLKVLFLSTRHGIGGAITDNAHIEAIRNALLTKRSQQYLEFHTIGASALAVDNLDTTFHGQVFEKRGEHRPLDPLTVISTGRLKQILSSIRPHIALYLDAPKERLMQNGEVITPELLLKYGIAVVVSSTESLPVSGFWAVKSLIVQSLNDTFDIELYPTQGERTPLVNVYRESDYLARVFGTHAKPTFGIANREKEEAKAALHELGLQNDHKMIYVHAGTSTALKEYTPRQLRSLILSASRELRSAAINLKNIAFVVSSEPRDRPEVSDSIVSVLKKLGATVILAPVKDFGFFRGVLSMADGAICADTAACHMANALNVPTVTLFGNPDPDVPLTLWGPVSDITPSSVAVHVPSETDLAKNQFPSQAVMRKSDLDRAAFFIGLILTAVIEEFN